MYFIRLTASLMAILKREGNLVDVPLDFGFIFCVSVHFSFVKQLRLDDDIPQLLIRKIITCRQ
jgi:hypothetical protein